MTSNLFIPTKIRVGFQNRKDTYTQKLAYIIYYDNKGKIRKEKSWDSWRDKSIEAVEFDNVPTDGFTLNKDVKRYNGEWFSSTRTLIRVYDPRGLEFEITTENLIGVLMHTDCLRRGLIGEFVYAWAGQELVLLPTNSEEYQAAIKYTSGLSKKVKAKELIEGATYRTKRGDDVVYLGKFDYYDYFEAKYGQIGPRTSQKLFIFSKLSPNYGDKVNNYFTKTSIEFLSELLSETTPDYLQRLDYFKSTFGANKIIKYELIPVNFDERQSKGSYGRSYLNRANYFSKNAGHQIEFQLAENYSQDSQSYQFSGYIKRESRKKIDISNGNISEVEQIRNCDYFYRSKVYSLDEIRSSPLADLYVTFESGKKAKVNSLDKLSSTNLIKYE